jgi:murein L,D-transpeptidase YafK
MLDFSRVRRTGALALAGCAVLLLAACNDYVGKIPKHMAPLDAATRELVDKKGMDQKAPILIRVFKQESTLEVWKKEKATGRYALLKDYKICAWSGVLGPKLKEGDKQAPEGFYTIRPAQMNPNSNYYLSFNIGYPNDFDRVHGRTGTHLMVHGACSSAGCYSMTDEQIQEIYTLGRLAFEGGQRDFQVQAFPFRMTAENMAKHRDNPNMPFWKNLKEGYDHFEVIRQPPKIDVCDKRYVFNSVPANGGTLNASAQCPALNVPDAIRIAVAEKAAKDEVQIATLVSKFEAQQQPQPAATIAAAPAAPMSVARKPLPIEAASAPAAAPTASAKKDVAAAAAEKPAPAADPQPALPATAYVQEAPRSGVGGFFSRVMQTVNPF